MYNSTPNDPMVKYKQDENKNKKKYDTHTHNQANGGSIVHIK